MAGARETIIHGTCIALGGAAALLRGAPGAGKSDLALRFVIAFQDKGAALVADDRVVVRARAGHLLASCPPELAGLVEVRGIGIVALDNRPDARLGLVVDLVPGDAVPRLPPEPLPRETVLGVSVPVIAIAPFEASAPVKLRLAIEGTRG